MPRLRFPRGPALLVGLALSLSAPALRAEPPGRPPPDARIVGAESTPTPLGLRARVRAHASLLGSSRFPTDSDGTAYALDPTLDTQLRIRADYRHAWGDDQRYILGTRTMRYGTGETTETRVVVMPSIGDPDVPVGMGITLARAAGFIVYDRDDPRYGKSQNPVLDPQGEHGFVGPDPSKTFDLDSFLIAQIARYMSKSAREFSWHACQATRSCDWIPEP